MLSRIILPLRMLRSDMAIYWRRKNYTPLLPLSEKQKKCLDILRRDGICTVENYWTAERCTEFRELLEKEVQEQKDRNYDNGAYIRFNRGKNPKDQGVVRIYHAEKFLPPLGDFRNDPFILGIASAYFGIPMFSGFVAFQHNLPSVSDTREYHVDWWEKEFKAFIYLGDVDLTNGPFAYIPGSHRAYFSRYRKVFLSGKGLADTSFFARDLGGWMDREKIMTGKAGTLLLADVTGFHRGLPQTGRTRSLLYNNIYPKKEDIFPDR